MAGSIQQAAIAVARGQVGYVETRSNITKYAAQIYPAVQGAAWCGVFAAWCYREAGVDLRPHVWMPFVPYIEAWAKKIGAWATDRAQTGDLVIYGFGQSSGQHVGIAWPDENASGYRAIEGNTSTGSTGSQANGGQVAIRYRGRSSIRGWVRMATVLAHYGVSSGAPVADAAKPTTGLLVADGVMDRGNRLAKEIQERLRTFDSTVQVDGVLGPHSIRVLEAAMGTTRDGVLTGQNAYCRAKCPAMRTDCFTLGGGGSRTVRRLQAYTTGCAIDGLWGDSLNRALVHMLNAYPAFLTTEDAGIIAQRIAAAGVQ